MTVVQNRVDKGRYVDSVALMRVARVVSALPQVEAAALMIGTPSNKALMRDAFLLAAEGEHAGANDLVIAVRAKDADAATAALASAAKLLSEETRTRRDDPLPHARTLAGALDTQGGSNLAIVSVPGEFAALEARRALGRGLHTLVFSNNVPLAEERALKELARDKGLLLMGPDCGTALIAGTPIAFANAVPRGRVGIVSASGTGLQEVSTLIARLGGGVSHGIGVGGRDLDAAIGAIGTLSALDALDRDGGTDAIVLISKPPAAEVAQRVLARVGASRKRFVVCFLGLGNASLPPNARLARTLTEAAELAMETRLAATPPDVGRGLEGKFVRGLYCGGTLCSEARLIFKERGLATGPREHLFLDLGDDEYTRGRPHPMIEPELRNDHVRQALADDAVAALLFDVVLGYGAHADPAGVLLRNDLGRKLAIASVVGTERDPQGYSRQVAALRQAGVIVAASNAHAAAYAARVASQSSAA